MFLAAYGTLMTGETNGVAAAARASMVSLGPGRLRGRLFRVRDIGRVYPAFVPGMGWVECELFRLGQNRSDAAALLRELDRYEVCLPQQPHRSDYVRRWLSVTDGGTVRHAFVYCYNRPVRLLQPMPEGRWRCDAA